MEEAWDMIKLLVSHEDDPASLSIEFGSITYVGNQGFMQWHERGSQTWSNSVNPLHILQESISKPLSIYSSRGAAHLVLRDLGQAGFSKLCEGDLSLLDGLFRLVEDHLHVQNIWDLEAASEDLGRELYLILEKCGIDAQAYVRRMMSIDNREDVYLQPVDYGIRGVGHRRLMAGKKIPLSLRWEWAPPPKENPYPFLEEFSYLWIENHTGFNLNGVERFEWPFSPVAWDAEQQTHIRSQERKARKAQRKDKVHQRLKKIPGAFVD